jgi:hypothetical protein
MYKPPIAKGSSRRRTRGLGILGRFSGDILGILGLRAEDSPWQQRAHARPYQALKVQGQISIFPLDRERGYAPTNLPTPGKVVLPLREGSGSGEAFSPSNQEEFLLWHLKYIMLTAWVINPGPICNPFRPSAPITA